MFKFWKSLLHKISISFGVFAALILLNPLPKLLQLDEARRCMGACARIVRPAPLHQAKQVDRAAGLYL